MEQVLKIKLRKPLPENRSLDQVYNHYVVEKRLATKLRDLPREERTSFLQHMYAELFREVPDHPRLTASVNESASREFNKSKLNFVKRFLGSSKVIVEFAPGDCMFCGELCKYVEHVYGVDISDQRNPTKAMPDNFELFIYDGYNLPFEDNSIDVFFSDQLLEHLPPEDLCHHFSIIRKALKKGGVYVLRTPHSFTGPHDISQYFSDVAEGFHLKEWTYTELKSVLETAEFDSYKIFLKVSRSRYVHAPSLLFLFSESIFKYAPTKVKRLAFRFLANNIHIAAFK